MAEEADLGIAIELVQDVIRHAKAFDAAIPLSAEDMVETTSEDEAREALAEYSEDPTYIELQDFIDSLNEEEQINLVALTWIGRGTFAPDEWEDALQEARDAHNEHTGEYLLGMPLLGTFLEDGLEALGYEEED
jgi:hypothetical protein